MTQDELKALISKVESETATDDEKLLALEELNRGVDELLALAEEMPDVTA